MNLKDILADSKSYPDALVFDMGGGTKVTLGELRGLTAAQQKALSDKEAEYAAANAGVAAKEAELKKAQVNTANLYTTVTQAVAALQSGKLDDPAVKQVFGDKLPNLGSNSNNNNNNNDPWATVSKLEQDSLLGPMVTVVKALAEQVKAAQAQAAAVVNTQKEMATSYLNETLLDRYDKLVPADKQDKITLESLIQTAVRNGYRTPSNMPDIRRALRDATAAEDAAAREAQIRADERAKIEKEMAAAGRGRDIALPGGGGGVTRFGLDSKTVGKGSFSSLDEAFKAAENDSEIWASVDQLSH